MDCEFIDCNLSMTRLDNTSLKQFIFSNCKLLGIEFSSCADFMFGYILMIVFLIIFFANKKMPKTTLIFALKEVSFIGTNLSNSVLTIVI
jgi:uncharacterized protein YjbI with pentapeptide repeats